MNQTPPTLAGNGGGAQIKAKLAEKKSKEKSKKPSKEQVEQMANSLLQEYVSVRDTEEACKCVKELRMKSYSTKLVFSAIMMTVEKSEEDRVFMSKLLLALCKERLLDEKALLKTLDLVFEQLADLSIDVPMIHQYTAGFVARMVLDELVELRSIGNMCAGGELHRVFLSTLELIHQTAGEEKLCSLFHEAAIDLYDVLPENRRTESDLMEIVEDKNLNCLYPMLVLKKLILAELPKCMRLDDVPSDGEAHSGAEALISLLKGLPDSFRVEAFTRTVCFSIIQHITLATTMKDGVMEMDSNSLKLEKTKEENFVGSMTPVFKYLVLEDRKLQIEVIYAVQMFCHENKVSKGSPMLRFSKYLYDIDIIYEDAFMAWREEINHDIPGKGAALIAINEYLNWMRTAVEESSDEGSDVD